jgi:putative redox protein
MTARCEKVMATDLPRRIAALRTVIEVPIAASHPHRAALENAAHTCPVHKSLRADLDASVEFMWKG